MYVFYLRIVLTHSDPQQRSLARCDVKTWQIKDFKYDYGNTRHLFISPWTSCLLLTLFNERIYLTQMQIYHKALYLSSFIYISARVVSRWIPFLKKMPYSTIRIKFIKYSCSRKQWEDFMGFELMSDRYPSISTVPHFLRHTSNIGVGVV